MLKPYIAKAVGGEHLTRTEATEAMQVIMNGHATSAQIAGLLMALRCKGEVVDELVGFATVMRSHALAFANGHTNVIDTCGTGGDGKGTLNISTAAALVAAASGVRVAKHGNRSVSSRCGSADLLERWGVRLDTSQRADELSLDVHGITFLFAPRYQPAMKHAAGPRREMGVRTVFNLLGPLTNPAGVKHQVLGVFDVKWVEPLARTLRDLGAEHAMVVSSADGQDEISSAAPTHVAELRDGAIAAYTVEPGQLGYGTQALETIVGGDAEQNATRLEAVLKGEEVAAHTAVALNAGAALYVAGAAESIREGASIAGQTLKSGRAWERLVEWAEWTRTQE
jgi:anthranilate phosphoribosyltransferase